MADARVLVVVDGIFNLTTFYPAHTDNTVWGPDAWFTISHFISTLRNSSSPTFAVDTASRGFANVPPGDYRFRTITNTVPDPAATVHGHDANQSPIPFRFDDPNVDLLAYREDSPENRVRRSAGSASNRRSKRQIAARLSISRASVRRMLRAQREASRAKLAGRRA